MDDLQTLREGSEAEQLLNHPLWARIRDEWVRELLEEFKTAETDRLKGIQQEIAVIESFHSRLKARLGRAHGVRQARGGK